MDDNHFGYKPKLVPMWEQFNKLGHIKCMYITTKLKLKEIFDVECCHLQLL
jgi:hypothetical protein